MDLTTLIGVLVGTFLIVQGIGLDKLGNFYDIKSILIVVGGTLAATAASYPLSVSYTHLSMSLPWWESAAGRCWNLFRRI